jgi:hypothetical protein
VNSPADGDALQSSVQTALVLGYGRINPADLSGLRVATRCFADFFKSSIARPARSSRGQNRCRRDRLMMLLLP